MHSRYMGYSMWIKSMAFIPCVIGFITFLTLIGFYGRISKEGQRSYGGQSRHGGVAVSTPSSAAADHGLAPVGESVGDCGGGGGRKGRQADEAAVNNHSTAQRPQSAAATQHSSEQEMKPLPPTLGQE